MSAKLAAVIQITSTGNKVANLATCKKLIGSVLNLLMYISKDKHRLKTFKSVPAKEVQRWRSFPRVLILLLRRRKKLLKWPRHLMEKPFQLIGLLQSN